MPIAKVYAHQEVETTWYRAWVESNYFSPAKGDGPYFSMVIPPPNVTGSLHMGHALNNTLQDILCRYKRMDGHRVLWVPGTDHAGIATQNVVERRLAAEGLSRGRLGRGKFIERVWAWREEAGGTIIRQLQALGVSCDWSRERFTMDEGLSIAVREAFVRLSEEGLLYRAERLINWCPRCRTALADIEVVHEEIEGRLWYVRYPLLEDPGRYVVVATTRPETMLGDVAVAVHPNDARYKTLIGKKVAVPISGRPAVIISEKLVDPEFGSGALKITPAHDFNDFDIGERHGLPRIPIFDEQARIAAQGFGGDSSPDWLKPYLGKDRFAARSAILTALESSKLLERTENHRHAQGRCYRCQAVIEPYLTPQWFVKTQPLAAPAIAAVRNGAIRIIPEGWANSYFQWMENIKDWCVSRQVWWGHQIPAWYCDACDGDKIVKMEGEVRVGKGAAPLVSREEPDRCPRCAGRSFVRDPDVLDTWFSSALWPFSTLGWPAETEDLKSFYPTSVLVTGFDILFFWVARMIMMGLKFMGEAPFGDVYIHALVRDQEGQKMSKSKGNAIDPLDIMARYGTDAFRFTLASMAAMGRDIKLAEERIAGCQSFVNKAWNAARFVLTHVERHPAAEKAGGAELAELRDADLNLADRWILSRLAATVAGVREAIDSYRFNDAAHIVYQFTWHEFCDWYVEMSKLSLNGVIGDDPVKTTRVLAGVLREVLLLLHPIMPFVTEELWSHLSPGSGSIMVKPYPESRLERREPAVEQRVAYLMDIIRSIRNLRTEMNVQPSAEVAVSLFAPGPDLDFLKRHEPYIKALARAGAINYASDGQRPKGAATAVVGATEVYLPVADLTNLEEERKRLTKEVGKAEDELERIYRKLKNDDFLKKARAEIVLKEKEKASRYEEQLRTLQRSLRRIEEIGEHGGG